VAFLRPTGDSAVAGVGKRPVWRLMLSGVVLLVGFSLLTLVFSDSAIGAVTFGVGGMLVCAPLYQGLVRWNQLRIRSRDSADWLNGLSAVLVLTGSGTLLRPWIGLEGGSFATAQVLLLGWAAVVTVSGTAVWMSVLGRLLRDRATVIGSLVVLVAGVAVLVANAELARRSDGSRLASFYAVAGMLGAGVRLVRLVRDLAELARSRREALTDELTGVANRRALLAAIDQALAPGGARVTTLLIVDLDRFKAINDRYGHAAGDELLRHMAEAFAEQVPAGGLLARLGGDEFAVLLREAGMAEAVLVARSLARAAAPLSDVKGRVLQVGASVGVARLDTSGWAGGELLRRADAAMYQAKLSGSGVQVYDSELDAAAQHRLELIEDLHRALSERAGDAGQIVVYFQPQLTTGTGRVAGAEALARWRHPRHGLLAPETFIHLAEDNGLMPILTALVVREAAAQAARWRADGHELRVAVNLSAGCLAHPALLPLIDEVLDGGMPARDLVLEVTETSLMTDPGPALGVMQRIAERGVGISIDDYGTGYSSLRYLNDLPATELKIDRSFIVGTMGDPRTWAIVAATVELAHRLGMRLVAEGVEDGETLARLHELGCDETQGYLHSCPLPAEGFAQLLAGRLRLSPLAGPLVDPLADVPAPCPGVATPEPEPGPDRRADRAAAPPRARP
jgi:diguanylate cyclase (GGDEF)-like protein